MFINNKDLIESTFNTCNEYIKYKERSNNNYFNNIFTVNQLDLIKEVLDEIKEELIDFSYDYYTEYLNTYDDNISFEMYFTLTHKNVSKYIMSCR